MNAETVAEAVKRCVNKHGELHLDKGKTEALINWLDGCEKYRIDTLQILRNLCELMRPILGEDYERIMGVLSETINRQN